MSEVNEDWANYSKLVLKELERLNDNYDRLRKDFDSRFQELNNKLTEVKTVETTVNDQKNWIERVK